MTSDDKAFAVVAVALLIGLGGTCLVGWPALPAAVLAIYLICRDRTRPDVEEG